MEIYSKSLTKKVQFPNRKVSKSYINLLVAYNSYLKMQSFIEISNLITYFWKKKVMRFCINWVTSVLLLKNKLTKKSSVHQFLCHLKSSDNNHMGHRLMYGHLVLWFIICSLKSITLSQLQNLKLKNEYFLKNIHLKSIIYNWFLKIWLTF